MVVGVEEEGPLDHSYYDGLSGLDKVASSPFLCKEKEDEISFISSNKREESSIFVTIQNK